MERVGDVLDLRCVRRTLPPPSQVSVIHYTSSVVPLDLSTPKPKTLVASDDLHLSTKGSYGQRRGSQSLRVRREFQFVARKSVVVDRRSLNCNMKQGSDSDCKKYWDHTISQPSSIDSDSGFENDQESPLIKYPTWFVECNAVDVTEECKRRDSLESIDRRESVSSTDRQDSSLTDTEFDKDLCDPTVTLQDPLQPEKSDADSFTMLKFSRVKAEVIDVEDMRSEILAQETDDHDTCDDDEEGVLHVDETCIEELFRVQLDANETPKSSFQRSDSTSSSASSLSASIRDKATTFLAEIKKSKTASLAVEKCQEYDKIKKYCMKCQDVFHSNAALLRHLMTHSSRNPGEKLIRCPVCTKRLCTVGALERHIMKMHTGDMPFVCQVCDAPFKFHTHLQRHLSNTKCSRGIPPKKRKPHVPPKEKKSTCSKK